MLPFIVALFFIATTLPYCVVDSAPVPREMWKLRLKIHQSVEEALLTPLNLFIMQEAFFPREEQISPPVSVIVSYNLTSESHLNSSIICSHGDENCNASFSYLWSQLPLPRLGDDCYSFEFLNSYFQDQVESEVVLPQIQLVLQLSKLPEETTMTLLHSELYGITKRLQVYASTSLPDQQNVSQKVMPVEMFSQKHFLLEKQSFAANINVFPCLSSSQTNFMTYSTALLCLRLFLHLTFFLLTLALGRTAYKVVFDNIKDKRNPGYSLYWCIFVLSLLLILGNLSYYQKSLLTDPNPIFVPFFISEFFVAILVVIQPGMKDFPIPFCLHWRKKSPTKKSTPIHVKNPVESENRNEPNESEPNESEQNFVKIKIIIESNINDNTTPKENPEPQNTENNQEKKEEETNCKMTPKCLFKSSIQVVTVWTLFVAVHVFLFPLVDRIVLLFETPLEALIEFIVIITLSYILVLIVSLFFCINPITLRCASMSECIENICSIILALAVGFILAAMILIGFTARSLAILYSNQNDSEGLTLFAVLTPASFAIIIAVFHLGRKRIKKGLMRISQSLSLDNSHSE